MYVYLFSNDFWSCSISYFYTNKVQSRARSIQCVWSPSDSVRMNPSEREHTHVALCTIQVAAAYVRLMHVFTLYACLYDARVMHVYILALCMYACIHALCICNIRSYIYPLPRQDHVYESMYASVCMHMHMCVRVNIRLLQPSTALCMTTFAFFTFFFASLSCTIILPDDFLSLVDAIDSHKD